MKAVLFLALVGAASAATVFNPEYVAAVTADTATCALKPGYAFIPSATAAATGSCKTQAAGLVGPGTASALNLKATATGCIIDPTPASSGGTTIMFLGCAEGYTATGAASYAGTGTQEATCLPPANTQPLAIADDGTTVATWVLTTTATGGTTMTAGAITGPATPYQFGTDATFKCTPTVANATNTTGCNISCIGKTCAADLPKTVADGTTLTGAQLCISGSFVSTSTIAAGSTGSYVCTGAATSSVAWDVVCSDTPTTTMTEAQWYAYVAGAGAFSQVKTCNCDPAVAVPNVLTTVGAYPNQFIPGPCVIKTCTATRSARAITAGSGIVCPSTYTTPAEIATCFEAAACAGKVTPADKCIYGFRADTTPLSTDCPACSESKKGLLGLLGLLGLIPLLLCSLLLCCLLLCIRRKKAEREVHFATFDAGAPNCDMPVVHNTSSVHHNTYVGAPHVGGPVACY